MRKPFQNVSELVGRSSARSRILTMDRGGKMFTAFTVQLPAAGGPHHTGRQAAVRTTEQEVHERLPLNPQFIHTHETPFARSVANQRAVLHIHLAKLVLSKNVSRKFIACLSSPMPPGLSHTYGIRAVLHRRPRADQIWPRFRLPVKSIACFLDFTQQPGSLHFARRRQLS